MYICTVIPEKIDNIDVFKGDTYVCLQYKTKEYLFKE